MIIETRNAAGEKVYIDDVYAVAYETCFLTAYEKGKFENEFFEYVGDRIKLVTNSLMPYLTQWLDQEKEYGFQCVRIKAQHANGETALLFAYQNTYLLNNEGTRIKNIFYNPNAKRY